MKKNILTATMLSMAVLLSTSNVFAAESETQQNTQPLKNPNMQAHPMKRPPHHKGMRPDKKAFEEHAKKFDQMLTDRLKLTEDQQKTIEKNRKKFRKEMDKVFSDMQKEQKKIRDVYMTGIPPYQANLRTSASKAKLAVLKQKADTLRDENRKNFEKVLTPEQKAEFEKIKQEMKQKRDEMRQKRIEARKNRQLNNNTPKIAPQNSKKP